MTIANLLITSLVRIQFTHVVYAYRLRLHICTLELLASLSRYIRFITCLFIIVAQNLYLFLCHDSCFQASSDLNNSLSPNAVRSGTHNSQAWGITFGFTSMVPTEDLHLR